MELDHSRTPLPCVTLECSKDSCVLCKCCEQNYCLQHIITHNNSTNRQLNSLIVEVNELDQQIKNLNIQPIIENCRRQLDKHRAEYHLKVDQYFERKYHELHRFIDDKVDHQQVEINRLQSKLGELTRKEEIEDDELYSLKLTIDHLQKEMNNIEEKHNQINIVSLQLDDSLMNIENPQSHTFNLHGLSTIYKTINHPDAGEAKLGSNDKFLLTYLSPNFILIDKQLNITKQILWPYAAVSNICWSSSMNRFLIIMNNNIYLLDDQAISIKSLTMPEKRAWFSCTCSDVSLFLSVDKTGSSIMEFTILPSIKLVNEWKSPFTCNKDEYIDDIVYNNLTLALMIAGKFQKTVRIELRSSKKLERIWSVQLDIERRQSKPFRCCSIYNDEW